MRVATRTMYDLVKYNLATTTEAMSQANKVVSSGKRISRLSDDPVGLTQALDIKSTLAGLEQLGRNISMGKSWLSAAEGALTHVQELVSDAKVLCIQMGTDTVNADQRQSAALQVQNMLDEVISLANTQIEGRYIFAGQDTGTAAFDSDGNYQGDDTPFSVKIGQDTTIAVGGDGQALFDGIISTMQTLKTNLENDDMTGIQTSMDLLDDAFDHVTANISDIGSKMVRMDIKENILQDLEISHTERLSKIEDADITEAITDLSAKEIAYQAALASSSKLMELSLVDYVD